MARPKAASTGEKERGKGGRLVLELCVFSILRSRNMKAAKLSKSLKHDQIWLPIPTQRLTIWLLLTESFVVPAAEILDSVELAELPEDASWTLNISVS
jgi:hypothetical protein